jgi:hypothetical protein
MTDTQRLAAAFDEVKGDYARRVARENDRYRGAGPVVSE